MGKDEFTETGFLSVMGDRYEKEFLYDFRYNNYIIDVAFMCYLSAWIKEFINENKLHKQVSRDLNNIRYSFSKNHIYYIINYLFFKPEDTYLDLKIGIAPDDNVANRKILRISKYDCNSIFEKYTKDPSYRNLIKTMVNDWGKLIFRKNNNTVNYYISDQFLDGAYNKILKIYNLTLVDFIDIDKFDNDRLVVNDVYYDNYSSKFIKFIRDSNCCYLYKCFDYDEERKSVKYESLNLNNEFINDFMKRKNIKSRKKAFKLIFSDIDRGDSLYYGLKPIVRKIKFSMNDKVSFEIVFNNINKDK